VSTSPRPNTTAGPNTPSEWPDASRTAGDVDAYADRARHELNPDANEYDDMVDASDTQAFAEEPSSVHDRERLIRDEAMYRDAVMSGLLPSHSHDRQQQSTSGRQP
jgi:hypothetical protein